MHDIARKQLWFRQYEKLRENSDLICSIYASAMDIVHSNVPIVQAVYLVKSQRNNNLSITPFFANKTFHRNSQI